MGLVRFGSLVTQVSGSVGGVVHARNRFGNYVRPRTKPVNPHSARQEAQRAILSYLAEYWHTELTPVQRNLWGVYAAAVAMRNRLGETVYVTGYNQFMRTNSSQMAIGQTVIDAAPTILSLPEKDADLVCSEEDVTGQTFTLTCNVSGWAPNGDPKFGIIVYQGQPKLASRNQFNGPWRLMDFIDATEGALGTATIAAAFAFAVGQKVWFGARVITESGRLSTFYQIDPRVVEADV